MISAWEAEEILGNRCSLCSIVIILLLSESILYQIQSRKQWRRNKRKGMAYPVGGINNDERVASIIRNHTAMKYARTITSCCRFDVQQDLHRFQPSVYHIEFDRMTELGEAFLKLQPDTPQIYYIWGHSYEFDYHDTWGKFEEFCRMMSGREDIFYGTNCEVLLSDVTDSLYHA